MGQRLFFYSMIGFFLIGNLFFCKKKEEKKEEISMASLQPGDPKLGKELFEGTCARCHGHQGEGIPNLGLPLKDSDFIQEKSEKELLEFIIKGRSPDDPDNITGLAMPPKGGNPLLTPQEILHIIAYLKEL